jgi:hypothetical protein
VIVKNKRSHYARGTFDEGEWNDSKYAVWLKTPNSHNWKKRLTKFGNNKVFELLFNELKAVVQQIPESVEKLLIVLHTAPFKECILLKAVPCPFDAYEGSVRIGEFINNVSKGRNVSAICGHRHKNTVGI